MKVEIVTIGDELLLGFTVDTNSAFLSRQLAAIGVEVVRHTSVRDLRAEIAAEVGAALSRTGAVITSGGLGPTSDDISVESVAALFGRDLVVDANVLARIEELFRSRGYTGALSATNKRQAMVPRGAHVLINRHGSAPGIWLEDARGWVAMLPGVPRELRGLFMDEMQPRIAARSGTANVVLSRALRTTGIAESMLAQRVLDSEIHFQSLAYLPGWEGVDLRVTARGMTASHAQAFLGTEIAKLRSVAGERAYGEDDADLAAVVLAQVRARSFRIAVAESCTGGMLGARLTAVPGASEVFAGGVIAYANGVKVDMLGVPANVLDRDGAVSEATVRAMAAGVCDRFGTQIGIAISGVAGPDGGSPSKPVGSVCVGVQIGGESISAARVLPGDREEIRKRAAQMALDMVRLALLREPG